LPYCFFDAAVVFIHPCTLHAPFFQHCTTMRTGEFALDYSRFLVHCGIPKDYFLHAIGAHKDIGPHRIVNLAFHFSVGMGGFIHPATFVFDLFKDALCLTFKISYIHRGIVVECNKSSCRREIVQHRFSCSKFGEWLPNFPTMLIYGLFRNRAIIIDLIPKGFYGRLIAA